MLICWQRHYGYMSALMLPPAIDIADTLLLSAAKSARVTYAIRYATRLRARRRYHIDVIAATAEHYALRH